MLTLYVLWGSLSIKLGRTVQEPSISGTEVMGASCLIYTKLLGIVFDLGVQVWGIGYRKRGCS